jgi:hypothetical protein
MVVVVIIVVALAVQALLFLKIGHILGNKVVQRGHGFGELCRRRFGRRHTGNSKGSCTFIFVCRRRRFGQTTEIINGFKEERIIE